MHHIVHGIPLFSVWDIGPECFPGHTEAYDVMCPPPSIELDEIEVEAEEADSMELETSSAREAFFARLNLLTTEEGTRIEEVLFLNPCSYAIIHFRVYTKRRQRRRKMKLPSYIPEVADKKYRYDLYNSH